MVPPTHALLQPQARNSRQRHFVGRLWEWQVQSDVHALTTSTPEWNEGWPARACIMCLCTSTCLCVRARVFDYVHVCLCTCTCVCVRPRVFVYVHACVYQLHECPPQTCTTFPHPNVCMHALKMHTHAHAHTPTYSSSSTHLNKHTQGPLFPPLTYQHIFFPYAHPPPPPTHIPAA